MEQLMHLSLGLWAIINGDSLLVLTERHQYMFKFGGGGVHITFTKLFTAIIAISG